MIKVALVRGKYLNNFEGQNYRFKDLGLIGVSSLNPIHKNSPFPVIKLASLADLEEFGLLRDIRWWKRAVKFLSNRILGDSQILFGLESLASKFDIFHTADPHYYYSYQLAKLKAKQQIKILIMTCWETIPFNNEKTRAKKYIKYFSLRSADHFICYTEKAKRCLIYEGIIGSKITVVRLGVDLNRFKRLTSNFGQKRNVTILFVGRLVEEKGILDLYEAYKILKHVTCNIKHFNLRLKIIGEGELKLKLINLIQQEGLGKFVSIEAKDYKDMPQVYQAADILVFPSKKTITWEEQYGMVLIEAMASGLPIVAYNTGAVSEVVGNAGVLMKKTSINDLVTSIKRLIEVNGLASKLGRIGRERAERMFDSRKTARKIAEIYKL